MELIDKILEEFEDTYSETLKEYKVDEVDALMMHYNQEITNLRQGDSLSNDRLRYYMDRFSYQMYRLRTIKARENLKANLTRHLHEKAHNHTLLNLEIPEGRKLIREEKMALAALETANEDKIAILYRAISNAIDERIMGLDKMLYNLSTQANLNMSEARLINKGGHVT